MKATIKTDPDPTGKQRTESATRAAIDTATDQLYHDQTVVDQLTHHDGASLKADAALAVLRLCHKAAGEPDRIQAIKQRIADRLSPEGATWVASLMDSFLAALPMVNLSLLESVVAAELQPG